MPEIQTREVNQEEFVYLLKFIEGLEGDFLTDVEIGQILALWTAYCLHNGLDCDTLKYDTDLSDLYARLEKKDMELPWNSYEDFDAAMCEYLC